jgi:polyhydroxyalkanoate synthesis regulator phasin
MLTAVEEATMELEDLKRTFEAMFGALSPSRAREIAKELLGEGSPREQVSKAASELLGWSGRGRERIVEIVRREVREQLRNMGLATRQEVEALTRRVRALERGPRAAARTKSSAKGAVRRAGSSRSGRAAPASGRSKGTASRTAR